MKKIILLFILIICLFSCAKKEQYHGTWSQFFVGPGLLKIQKDSISLSNDGNLWKTYPLTIKNKSLTFLDHTFSTSITNDTLLFGDLKFVQDTATPLLEIKLPELANHHFSESNDYEELILTQFGKVPGSDEYKLQFNDKYGNFEDFIDYFFDGTDVVGHVTKRALLVCDENIPMKQMNSLFKEMIKINAIICYSANHVEHKVVEGKIEQTYKTFALRISPILKVSDENVPSQYAYKQHHANVYELISEATQFVFLYKNKFYIENKQYDEATFTQKIAALVAENKQLVTFYDNDSNYKHFVKFNAIINDAYTNLYDSVSKEKYGVVYKELKGPREKFIMKSYPKRNLQNLYMFDYVTKETSVELLSEKLKEELLKVSN